MATVIGTQTGEKTSPKGIVLTGTALLAPGDTTLSIPIPTEHQAPTGRDLEVDWVVDMEEDSGAGALPPVTDPPLHAPTHISAGTDEIDGDKLDIDFTPTNYVPDTTPPEVTLVDELTSHLSGIDNALATAGAVPSQLNKNMTPSLTSSDGDVAIGAPGIGATPVSDGYVTVMVNGQLCHVGDGVKTTECYFSGDGGTTARLIDDIIFGDTLHWNGSVAKFEISTNDRMEFLFAA